MQHNIVFALKIYTSQNISPQRKLFISLMIHETFSYRYHVYILYFQHLTEMRVSIHCTKLNNMIIFVGCEKFTKYDRLKSELAKTGFTARKTLRMAKNVVWVF